MLWILFLISLGSAFGDPCVDNPSFYRDDDPTKTCADLATQTDERKAWVCRRDDVKLNCPFTCDLCDENCVDHATYTFFAWKGDRNCAWLGMGTNVMQDRKQSALCNVIKNGSYVKDKCKKSCKNCEINDDFSSSPSGSPSLSLQPSVAYNDCIDNPSFRLDGNSKFDCTFLRRNTRETYCKIDAVRKNCKLTCGLCCEDDTSFKFGNRNQRDCAWIGADATRKTRLCADNRFKNDKRIIYVCSSTCGTCENEVTL